MTGPFLHPFFRVHDKENPVIHGIVCIFFIISKVSFVIINSYKNFLQGDIGMKGKNGKEKFYIITIALAVLAIACIVTVSSLKGDAAAQPEVPVATPRPEQKTVIKEVEKIVEVEKEISSEIIEDGLRDMGVLITEEYYFTDVISFSSVKKFLKTNIELGFTESSYLAGYDGVVAAGIDFSKVRVDKDDENTQITVYVPKAELQYVDIDLDSFVLYSEKSGIGNPLSADDFNASLIELENTAKTKAEKRGILERADENAENMISNFIGGLVDTSVYSVRFITD